MVVWCDGEIDLSTCDQLRRALAKVVAEKPTRLVVNLTGTRFLDSSAVRCLMAAQAACRDQGVGFRCEVTADSPIVRLFHLLGVTAQLDAQVAERGTVAGTFIDHVRDGLDEAVADATLPSAMGKA